ncbi:MAG TPA: serine/threonine-protein kinase [Pyrinomonadaceae bacterium]
MLQCPKCLRRFDSDAAACPDDGTPLRADATVPSGAADAPPAVAPAAAASDPLVGLVLDDKYRLDERLGVGGMGTVYRATHLLIERPVAVKVLNARLVADETARERFRREARAAGRLQHSNAVAVTDFGETREGVVYLVMELLEGLPMRDVLARESPLDPARAVSLMLQIAAAVEAAHEAGIIHRDLKPGNIFLVQRPDSPYIVKVLDFGIAKLATSGEAGGEFGFADTLTGTGVMIGTPRYMSPEQCDGAPLTPASDVYSLGVILYEMLTGQTPFSGGSPLALALAHSSEEPRPPRELAPNVPPALEAVVLHALAKGAGERPADAGEFRRELFAVAERLGLEHYAGFSAPTLETLRDVGAETPSGRLVIDIERLRRTRAAAHTEEVGQPTSEEEAPYTAGRPAVAVHAPHDAGGGDEGDERDEREHAGARGAQAAQAPADAGAREVYEAGAGRGRRGRARRGGVRRGWRDLLTHPLAFVVIISAALLLVFGGVLLRRAAQQRRGPYAAAGPAGGGEEAADAFGRTLSGGEAETRSSLVSQPRTAADYYENGAYFISIRSYDAAVRDLQKAVELQPEFPEAHNRLGRALMRKGQFRAAADSFRKAVEQRGGRYPTAQYNLGFALQQQGEREQAVEAYMGAQESNDGHYPDALYQVAVIRYEQGRWDEAAQNFQRVIELNGGRDPEAYYRLGAALVQQKKYEPAERAFREAVAQRGGDFAFAHYNLGLLYQQTERYEEAIKEFEAYLEQAPGDENRHRAENTLRDLRRRAARRKDD